MLLHLLLSFLLFSIESALAPGTTLWHMPATSGGNHELTHHSLGIHLKSSCTISDLSPFICRCCAEPGGLAAYSMCTYVSSLAGMATPLHFFHVHHCPSTSATKHPSSLLGMTLMSIMIVLKAPGKTRRELPVAPKELEGPCLLTRKPLRSQRTAGWKLCWEG